MGVAHRYRGAPGRARCMVFVFLALFSSPHEWRVLADPSMENNVGENTLLVGENTLLNGTDFAPTVEEKESKWPEYWAMSLTSILSAWGDPPGINSAATILHISTYIISYVTHVLLIPLYVYEFDDVFLKFLPFATVATLLYSVVLMFFTERFNCLDTARRYFSFVTPLTYILMYVDVVKSQPSAKTNYTEAGDEGADGNRGGELGLEEDLVDSAETAAARFAKTYAQNFERGVVRIGRELRRMQLSSKVAKMAGGNANSLSSSARRRKQIQRATKPVAATAVASSPLSSSTDGVKRDARTSMGYLSDLNGRKGTGLLVGDTSTAFIDLESGTPETAAADDAADNDGGEDSNSSGEGIASDEEVDAILARADEMMADRVAGGSSTNATESNEDSSIDEAGDNGNINSSAPSNGEKTPSASSPVDTDGETAAQGGSDFDGPEADAVAIDDKDAATPSKKSEKPLRVLVADRQRPTRIAPFDHVQKQRKVWREADKERSEEAHAAALAAGVITSDGADDDDGEVNDNNDNVDQTQTDSASDTNGDDGNNSGKDQQMAESNESSGKDGDQGENAGGKESDGEKGEDDASEDEDDPFAIPDPSPSPQSMPALPSASPSPHPSPSPSALVISSPKPPSKPQQFLQRYKRKARGRRLKIVVVQVLIHLVVGTVISFLPCNVVDYLP